MKYKFIFLFCLGFCGGLTAQENLDSIFKASFSLERKDSSHFIMKFGGEEIGKAIINKKIGAPMYMFKESNAYTDSNNKVYKYFLGNQLENMKNYYIETIYYPNRRIKSKEFILLNVKDTFFFENDSVKERYEKMVYTHTDTSIYFNGVSQKTFFKNVGHGFIERTNLETGLPERVAYYNEKNYEKTRVKFNYSITGKTESMEYYDDNQNLIVEKNSKVIESLSKTKYWHLLYQENNDW